MHRSLRNRLTRNTDSHSVDAGMDAPRAFRIPLRYHRFLGIALAVLYVGQATYLHPPEWLTNLQSSNEFKLATGSLFLAVLLWQVTLALSRGRLNLAKKKAVSRHKWIGSLSPIFLFIHTASYGHAYQVVLVTLFLANIVIGGLHDYIKPLKLRLWRNFWILVHVCFSTVVMSLIAYHVYVALTYW